LLLGIHTTIRPTHLRLKQITINPDAFTSLLARKNGCHDGAMGIEARPDIRARNAHLDRGSIGFAGTKSINLQRPVEWVKAKCEHMH
jgi:hypothetical protein